LGDCWDVDILDVGSRAVIVRRHGPRTAQTINAAFAELKERLAPDHVPGLLTSDEHGPYVEAALVTFGKQVPATPRRASGGRPPLPTLEPDPKLVYAQVDKKRSPTGRLEKVETRQIFGTPQALAQRLEDSQTSRRVNTAFLERENGVDRHFNPRKARQVCEFSKSPAEHRAVSWLTLTLNIFCWAVRTLTENRPETSGSRGCSPAMALGRADRVLTVGEFIRLRPLGFNPPPVRDIRLKKTEFHQPERPPPALERWPRKGVVRKSLARLGISARGIG